MSMRARLLLLLLPLALASAGAMAVVSRRAAREVLVREVGRRGLSIVVGLAASPGVGSAMSELSERRLLPALQAAVERHGAAYALATDERGRVLAHTDVGQHGGRYSAAGGAVELVQRRRTAAGRQVLEVLCPVRASPEQGREAFLLSGERPAEGRRLGVLGVGLPLEEALATADRIAREFLLVIVFVQALLFAALLACLRVFLRPIRDLAAATERVAAGELSAAVPVSSADELGRLAELFNRMSGALAQTTVSREFLDGILSNMPDALLVSGPDGRIRVANRSASILLGYPPDELQGLELTRVLPIFPAALPAVCDAEVLAKEGRKIPVRVGVCAARGRGGEAGGRLVCFMDMTERRRAEEELASKTEELASSNQALERFAYVASHDLQEPLRKIVGFADRLQAHLGGGLDEHGGHYLARIQAAARRMSELIERLLTLARVGKRERAYESVDLGEVISEVLSDLEPRIQASGAVVQAGALPRVEADALQMRQLFQNLLSNALKFTKKGESPRVAVRGRELAGDLVEVEVQDSGVGFDSRFQERIFKPFSRLHTREEYEGSGIGLAICERIVREHGGTLTARSSPGLGATFRIVLPARRAAATGSREPGRVP